MIYTLVFEDKVEFKSALDMAKQKDKGIFSRSMAKLEDPAAPEDVCTSLSDLTVYISDKNGNHDVIIDVIIKALDLIRKRASMDGFGVSVVSRKKVPRRK